MNTIVTFRPQLLTTVVVGLLALIGGFLLANGPAARGALEKAGLLANPVIPVTFNYQGFLREADGTLTNGTYKITAKVYDEAAGGIFMYTEMFENVTVRDGLFNIVLGDQGSLENTFDSAPRYIGITLNDEPELIPRERVHGVPWAIHATNATNATTLVPGAVVNDASTINASTINAKEKGVVVGEESELRIVRGRIEGDTAIGEIMTPINGKGFKYTRLNQGYWSVSFDEPFTSEPTITVSALWNDTVASLWGVNGAPTTFKAEFGVTTTLYDGTRINPGFDFIAIGPR